MKAIQDEYQGYMERVRGVAQGAIDAANTGFQAARHAVTGRLDAAVHQLQARFFSAPVRWLPAAAGARRTGACLAWLHARRCADMRGAWRCTAVRECDAARASAAGRLHSGGSGGKR